MGSFERGPAHAGMGRERLGSGKAHRVVVMVVLLLQGREAGSRLGLTITHLTAFQFPAFRSSHDLTGAILVGGVVKERSNVVHKQRIERLRDLLLVGKI